MKETKYYCDRCKSEIVFVKNSDSRVSDEKFSINFNHKERTSMILNLDGSSGWINVLDNGLPSAFDYELCRSCYFELLNQFMKGVKKK